MPDEEKLAAVRAALPAVEAGIYLNAGSVGPMPAETAKAMADLEAWELRTGGRTSITSRNSSPGWTRRGATAAVLGTDVDAIALNHSTTDGMNQAIAALDWRPADRAVSSQLEHAGGVGALHALHARLGVDLTLADAGAGGDDEATLAAFDAAITPGTRLVALAHVSPMTGALLPIARIAELAHARGRWWSSTAPRRPARSRSTCPRPARTSMRSRRTSGCSVRRGWAPSRSGRGPPSASTRRGGRVFVQSFDPRGDVSFWTDARRFDGSGFHRPSVVGMARSIGWLSMYVGLDWIHARGRTLARRTAARLAAIDGVDVITPLDRMATLVTFRIASWPARAALEELGARVFAIARTIDHLDALRISVGFWATDAELERFAEAVELLAKHTPDTMPARRTLTVLGPDA